MGRLAPARRALCAAPPAAASSLPDVLERLKIEPDALPSNTDNDTLLRNITFLEGIGVPDIAAAVSRDRGLLTHDPATTAAPRIEYLLSLGISRVGPIVGKVPQLLSCDITNDLHRKVAILQALGVKRIASFVQRNPRLVLLDVEQDMRPPVEYLRSIENVNIGRVLDNAPNAVFGKTEALKAHVEYLEEELGLAPRWRVGTMISRWPQLLGCDLDNTIRPKVCAPALCTCPSSACGQ